jgi:transcriptional regulator with XRE-family HTH domain
MDFNTYQKKLSEDQEYQRATKELRVFFEFGNAVLRARIKKGWSQTELACQVGTKQANISRIEAGIANPTLDLINRLSTVLGIPVTFKESEYRYTANINYVIDRKLMPGFEEKNLELSLMGSV